MNLRSIDIYVATADGAYRYDAEAHRLVVVSRQDVRALTGGQDYVKVAPVALVYVADHRQNGDEGRAARGAEFLRGGGCRPDRTKMCISVVLRKGWAA